MVATTITFTKPGVQAPVYVAGGFTDWQPTEMNYEAVEKDGVVENHFSYTADLQRGEYQYKFRLGPGDWWVLDESTPTSDDGVGNINNLLIVQPEETRLPADTPAGREAEVPVSTSSVGDTESPTEISAEEEAPKDTPPEHEPQAAATAPQTAVENFDGTKEDTIPDIAPPPYEEHHAAPASATSHETAPAVSIGIEKKPSDSGAGTGTGTGTKSVQSEIKQTVPSWFTQSPVLVAAIIAVPVFISYIWYR
ncbi:hypothetical protein A1O1_00358 [Capronia coronata CBS 617.96]|uniref:AMP-activated protein kinase glycogen-binding domain-containing protein n=1 Tax=Capronia coronata CBS 617.96 TaxID=1182541 RepID=W9YRP1_9EURO|nr:uncharacterized protein A1O1_00358 [Capronia coronata CBS 617.96]EXJ95238.1 hypothetical protein A1O1_00358 [Capronia coronata CBS 617.96]